MVKDVPRITLIRKAPGNQAPGTVGGFFPEPAEPYPPLGFVLKLVKWDPSPLGEAGNI